MAAKSVPVTLDKERHLKFNLGTLKRFGQATGKKMQGLKKLADLSADDLSALIWACLAWEDPSLTQDQVDEMVDMTNLGAVAKALAEAVGPLAKGPTG